MWTQADTVKLAKRIQMDNKAVDERAAGRRREARSEGERLARGLRDADTSVKAVWGFGSAFEESRSFRPDSDIDLAVEGGDILAAMRLVEKSLFTVDLVDITCADDPFALLVRTRGTRLV